MELLDVLDQNGNFTGRIKLRSLVHKDGDWHRSAHVWIVNQENKILVQKRSPNKDSHPNEWDISAAGHVLAGETSIGTATKEIGEELGLDTQPQNLKLIFSHSQRAVLNNGTFINNEINDVYLLRLNDLDLSKLILQKEEVSEVKWITIDELTDILKNKTPGYVYHKEEFAELIKLLKS